MKNEPSRARIDPLYTMMREHIEGFARGFAKGATERLEEALDCFAMADATSNEKISTAALVTAAMAAVAIRRMGERADQLFPGVTTVDPKLREIWLDMLLADVKARTKVLLKAQQDRPADDAA